MSMYRDYVEEREQGAQVLENESGFAKYKLFRDDNGTQICYLEDIYVCPKHRNKHEATKLADAVEIMAKEYGAQVIFGSVCTSMNNATDSLKVVLANGYRLSHLSGDMIYLKKNI